MISLFTRALYLFLIIATATQNKKYTVDEYYTNQQKILKSINLFYSSLALHNNTNLFSNYINTIIKASLEAHHKTFKSNLAITQEYASLDKFINYMVDPYELFSGNDKDKIRAHLEYKRLTTNFRYCSKILRMISNNAGIFFSQGRIIRRIPIIGHVIHSGYYKIKNRNLKNLPFTAGYLRMLLFREIDSLRYSKKVELKDLVTEMFDSLNRFVDMMWDSNYEMMRVFEDDASEKFWQADRLKSHLFIIYTKLDIHKTDILSSSTNNNCAYDVYNLLELCARFNSAIIALHCLKLDAIKENPSEYEVDTVLYRYEHHLISMFLMTSEILQALIGIENIDGFINEIANKRAEWTNAGNSLKRSVPNDQIGANQGLLTGMWDHYRQ